MFCRLAVTVVPQGASQRTTMSCCQKSSDLPTGFRSRPAQDEVVQPVAVVAEALGVVMNRGEPKAGEVPSAYRSCQRTETGPLT